MMAKAVFRKGDKVLGEFPIFIEGPGDLAEGARAAYAEFRRAFPQLSLFDDDVSVKFDRLEVEADADRS